jgi:hypothetical protein
VKFSVLAITTLAGRIFTGLVFFIPILYIFVTTAVIYKSPYLYQFNNFLDTVLYACSAAFALTPVLAFCGVTIPEGIVLPFAIVLFAVPVVSTVFLFCCLARSALYEANDCSMYECARRDQRKLMMKTELEQLCPDDRKNKLIEMRKAREAAYGIEDPACNNTEQSKKGKKKYQGLLPDLYTLGQDEELFQRDKDEGYFDSINLLSIKELEKEGLTAEMTVNRSDLTARFNKYYESLDTVIDSVTIDFLTTVLCGAMMFAAAAFGWFVGGLLTHEFHFDFC